MNFIVHFVIIFCTFSTKKCLKRVF